MPCTLLTFPWRAWRKPRKFWMSLDGVPVKIRTVITRDMEIWREEPWTGWKRKGQANKREETRRHMQGRNVLSAFFFVLCVITSNRVAIVCARDLSCISGGQINGLLGSVIQAGPGMLSEWSVNAQTGRPNHFGLVTLGGWLGRWIESFGLEVSFHCCWIKFLMGTVLIFKICNGNKWISKTWI